MAGASGPIGGPHFGTLPEKPAGKAGLYKFTVQAPDLEGKCTGGPGLGVSAGGG